MNAVAITKWWAQHAPDLAVAELPRSETLYEDFNSTFDDSDGELPFIDTIIGDHLDIDILYKQDIDIDKWLDDEPEPETEEEPEQDDWDFI